MRKLCMALMLCLVSIAGFADFSTNPCYGTRYSEGDFIPKSLSINDFRGIKWVLVSDNSNIILKMDDSQQMIFQINRKNVDSNTGIVTYFVTEMLSGSEMKLYTYLHEESTKYFQQDNPSVKSFELDINDYMNRRTISVLYFDGID